MKQTLTDSDNFPAFSDNFPASRSEPVSGRCHARADDAAQRNQRQSRCGPGSPVLKPGPWEDSYSGGRVRWREATVGEVTPVSLAVGKTWEAVVVGVAQCEAEVAGGRVIVDAPVVQLLSEELATLTPGEARAVARLLDAAADMAEAVEGQDAGVIVVGGGDA
ncbi:MAG: hypothetical protein LBR33_00855 [Propionibacteriaceae bacterium]|jgi:hypothetical protein|nr:hypothetical protein [Propionibacteriaceae bacterium]